MEFPYDLGSPSTPTSSTVFPFAANINPSVFQTTNDNQFPQSNFLLQESQKRPADSEESSVKKKKSKHKEKDTTEEDGDKKRVAKACVFCQRSHMSCDSARPCKRCVDRGVSELCVDPIPKRRGRRRKFLEGEEPPIVPPLLQPQTQEQTLKLSSSLPQVNSLLSPLNSGLLSIPITPKSSFSTSSISSPINADSSSPLGASIQLPHDSDISNEEDNFTDLPSDLVSELIFSPMDQMNNVVSERGTHNGTLRAQQLQQILQGKRDSSVSPQFAEIHLRHLREGEIEINETPSTSLRTDWLISFVEYMKKRAPEEAEQLLRFFLHFKPHINRVRQNLSKATFDSILKDFESSISFAKTAYEHVSVPTMVYEKCGVIHYVNKPFRSLTGFTATTPTSKDSFEVYNLISTFSLKRFLFTMLSAYTDGTTNSVIVPTEFLAYGKYIDVMACFSIKRDILGLPLVLTCHLLPVVFSPVLDVQMHSIANRPLEGMLVREKMQREQQLLEQASDTKKQRSNSQGNPLLSLTAPQSQQPQSNDYLSLTNHLQQSFSPHSNNNNSFPFGGNV